MQRVAGPLEPQKPPSHSAKLGVNERGQLIEDIVVAITPPSQQTTDVPGECGFVITREFYDASNHRALAALEHLNVNVSLGDG